MKGKNWDILYQRQDGSTDSAHIRVVKYESGFYHVHLRMGRTSVVLPVTFKRSSDAYHYAMKEIRLYGDQALAWPDSQSEKLSNPSRGHKYHVTLHHDRGHVTLEVWGTSKTDAVNMVMRVEGCPRSAIIKVSKVRY
jgi:hypothetical protein